MDLIYCDQAATSFPKPPQVVEAVCRALTETSASGGRSAHRMSLTAARLIFEAREAVADLLGAEDSSRIAFTYNVTQALNMVLLGLLKPGDHVLTSSMEHNSVMRPLGWLAQERKVAVEVVPSPATGLLDPAEFKKRLTDKTRLAVINHASNVTGAISPLNELKTAMGQTPLLVDAAQTAGALPLNVKNGPADILAFTGHKSMLGPTGTGGVWISPDINVEPLFRGGTGSRSEIEEHPDFMPDRLEAGTQNTHGLAGLAAGVKFILETKVEKIRDHELLLTRRFLNGLTNIKGVTVYGPSDADSRVAVVSINLLGWSPSDLAHVLDREFGIMTRAGLHCAPRAHRTIKTFPQGTVRFSFGFFNTDAEIDAILSALDKLSRRAE
ncbi:MAG: aminotransferase class V-fold PLP-dependent enzyme [Deltaproteobacteria bacterium]|nr:aminotransferase class V-fold PLP-dependent enzyme [Deltaproteobacteria bacterium]